MRVIDVDCADACVGLAKLQIALLDTQFGGHVKNIPIEVYVIIGESFVTCSIQCCVIIEGAVFICRNT